MSSLIVLHKVAFLDLHAMAFQPARIQTLQGAFHAKRGLAQGPDLSRGIGRSVAVHEVLDKIFFVDSKNALERGSKLLEIG